MELTIIERFDDAGRYDKVTVIRGGYGRAVFDQTRKRYHEIVAFACSDMGIENDAEGITYGYSDGKVWTTLMDGEDPFKPGWENGYIDWKYKDSSQSYNIHVTFRIVVQIEEVPLLISLS